MARPLRELLFPWAEYPTEFPQPSLDLPRPARLLVPALTLNDLATGEAPTFHGTAATIETIERFPLGQGRLFHPSGGSNGIVEVSYGSEPSFTGDGTLIWCGHVYNYTTANGMLAGRGRDGFGSGWNLLLSFTAGNALTAEIVTSSPLAGYSATVSGITATTGAEQRVALVRRGSSIFVYDWRTRQRNSASIGTGYRTSTLGFRFSGAKTTAGGGHNSAIYSALYPAALSDADVWALLDQPSLSFDPRRIWVPVVTSTAPTFNPAWARNSNILIQGTA